MTATFTFDLDFDQDLYDIFKDSEKMYSVLWDFDQELRSRIKDGFYDAMDGDSTAEHIREMLHDVMLEKGFKFA